MEYHWWENQLSLRTEGSRDIYGTILYGFGNFYTGKQNSLSLTANWKPLDLLFIGGTYLTNIVKLPEGEFVADIYQFNLNFLCPSPMILRYITIFNMTANQKILDGNLVFNGY